MEITCITLLIEDRDDGHGGGSIAVTPDVLGIYDYEECNSPDRDEALDKAKRYAEELAEGLRKLGVKVEIADYTNI